MNGPRDPIETVTELCLSVSCGGRVGSGLLQGQGNGAADLGMAWALLEKVTINPTIELPELKQDWELDS